MPNRGNSNHEHNANHYAFEISKNGSPAFSIADFVRSKKYHSMPFTPGDLEFFEGERDATARKNGVLIHGKSVVAVVREKYAIAFYKKQYAIYDIPHYKLCIDDEYTYSVKPMSKSCNKRSPVVYVDTSSLKQDPHVEHVVLNQNGFFMTTKTNVKLPNDTKVELRSNGDVIIVQPDIARVKLAADTDYPCIGEGYLKERYENVRITFLKDCGGNSQSCKVTQTAQKHNYKRLSSRVFLLQRNGSFVVNRHIISLSKKGVLACNPTVDLQRHQEAERVKKLADEEQKIQYSQQGDTQASFA